MHRRQFLSLVASVSVLPLAARAASLAGASGRVGELTLKPSGQGSQLVLELLGPVQYQSFSLDGPPRLVIDLKGTLPSLPAQRPDFSQTPIRGLRTAAHEGGLRLVLDFKQPIRPTVSLLPGATANQRLLVIDLPHAAAGLASAVHEPARATAPEKLSRRPIVAIDAGHGGKDPGAVSSSDRYEKDVVLSIAEKLRGMMGSSGMAQPVLSRDDDHFVALGERVQLAHQRKADLFVSIHADAAPSTDARGASVYVLSEHGATSTMARWMAKVENSADRFATPSELYNADPVLSKVLVDMSMTATIQASLALGRRCIDNLQQVTRIHQDRVDQAGFAVLKSPDIPSMLVETGFMSNRDDCSRLITDGHQQELAQALHSTIEEYFKAHPWAYARA